MISICRVFLEELVVYDKEKAQKVVEFAELNFDRVGSPSPDW
jgi:hypothetical protein